MNLAQNKDEFKTVTEAGVIDKVKDAAKETKKAATKTIQKAKDKVSNVMPSSNNIPVNLTIAKVIAKLHLSGKTQVSLKGFEIVNSGIVDDSDNGPDNPGKTTFDLESKTGEYELGIVTDIVVKIDIDKIMKEIGIEDSKKKIEDANKKLEDLKEKQKLTDDNEEVKKATEELKSAQDEAKETLKKYYTDTLGIKDDPLTDDMTPDQMMAKVMEKAQSKFMKDAYDKEVSNAAKNSLVALGNYMKMFAGDKYKEPKEDELVVIQVPKGFSGTSSDFKAYVKGFVINGISDDDIKKLDEEQQKKHPNEIERTICFKVKYKMIKEK